MRFSRYGRFDFQDTARKRAHVLRKQRKEREALPLFAEQIEGEQESVDSIMDGRAAYWSRHQRQGRQSQAQKWHAARQRLRAYPAGQKAALLAYWQRCRWPATPTYLLSMLHMFDHGRLDLNGYV